MTIENIAIFLEGDEITKDEAYSAFISEEEENDIEKTRQTILDLYDSAEISLETKNRMLSFII